MQEIMTDLNEIQIFAQVVSQGSFTSAATILGLTKSTISRKISALEKRLGVRLLTRSTRQLHLTEEGELFFKRCQRLMSDLEEAELLLSSSQENVTGHLSIVMPIELGQLVLGRVMGEYLQQYPDVTIKAELSTREVDMLGEGVDLMFRLGLGQDSSLISRQVVSSRPIVVASPAYIERRGRPKSPADLEKHECIAGKLQVWTFTKDGVEKTIKPSGVFKSNNITCVREVALTGLGIARLPPFLVTDALQEGRLVRLLENWDSADSRIYALYPNRRYMPQKLKTFLSFISEKLGPAWN
jgi:DNA-binding transcriptional LysR family regulator